jgi:hypothetical protein
MGETMKTTDFMREHENWRELLSKAPYFISFDEDDNFALLKYDQIRSDFSEPIVRECRGLIVDKNTYTPVALSFYKFFNVQEPNADTIDWGSAVVQEKVDGSKILLWFDNYEYAWRISTSGCLNASGANVGDLGVNFKDLFMEVFDIELFVRLEKNCCYTFELVSPLTRVVVPYEKTDIYFIGMRNMVTLEEVDPMGNFSLSHIKRPRRFSLNTLEDCLKATEQMGYDEEGFVVVDKNWHRVKIKSPAYVAAHHLKNNGAVSRKRILEIIEQGEQDEFLGYFPEYKKYFDEIEELMNLKDGELLSAIYEIDHLTSTDRKDFALLIMRNYKRIAPLLFKYLDGDFELGAIDNAWQSLPTDKKLEYLDRYKGEEK